MSKDTKKDFQIDSFEYNLASPIGYAQAGVGQAGTKLQTDKIKIVSPLVKNYIESLCLSQLMRQASLKAVSIFQILKNTSSAEDIKLLEEKHKQEEEEEENLADKTPAKMSEEVRDTIMTSDMDIHRALEIFKTLCLSGTVQVEETAINFIQWKEISPVDHLEMFFQFIAVFIQPSLFSPLKEEKE